MWKKIIILGIIVLTIVITFVMLSHSLTNAITDLVAEVEVNVGESLILNNDTLIIVDYSLLNNTYKLDNGVDINFELAEKLIIE